MKKAFLLALTAFIFCIGCQKNIDSDATPPVTPVPPVQIPAQTIISYSVKGKITDEKSLPVQGALITCGSQHAITDGSGYFDLANISGPDNNALVSVENVGYFKGSRAFIPIANNVHFVAIKLLKRGLPLTVDGAAGGNVSFSSGLQLQFPANSFVSANGLPYAGTVNIYSAYISPANADFGLTMPGDLRASDTGSATFTLHSFGMADVELQDVSGQKLNIAPGKKVRLIAPIPADQLANAPAQLPLWYCNDSTGNWKEDGLAIRSGNSYSGEVSHFTWWNFDVQNGYTYIKAKFVTPAGNPVTYRAVVITALNGPGGEFFFSGNYTTDQGKINALAPIIIGSKITMYDDCNQPIYTQVLSPVTQPLDLGTITLSNVPNTLTIKGKVVDCSNNPLSNSSVYVTLAGRVEKVNPGADGNFLLQTVGCLNSNQLNIYAINNSTNEQNISQSFSINSQDTVNAGTLVVCNNVADQFIQIIRDQDTFNYRFPECTKLYGQTTKPSASIDSSRTDVFALTPVSNFYAGIILNSVPYQFVAPGTMNIFYVSLPTADSIPAYDPIYLGPIPQMNITEYGLAGQYISGNFSGMLHRSNYQQSLVYNFKINFKVKRQ